MSLIVALEFISVLNDLLLLKEPKLEYKERDLLIFTTYNLIARVQKLESIHGIRTVLCLIRLINHC